MTALLKFFDVIPGWMYAAAIAVILLTTGTTIGVLTLKVASAKTEIATLKGAAETLRADNALAAHQYAEKARLDERKHAMNQQEIVDAYAQKLRDADSRRVADVARAARVSNDSAAAAARDRAEAGSDQAACQRVADRNAILYGLADEGFGLVAEGRTLLETRDAAVATLKALITNDRAAICGDGK